jgi:hypothetical protein
VGLKKEAHILAYLLDPYTVPEAQLLPKGWEDDCEKALSQFYQGDKLDDALVCVPVKARAVLVHVRVCACATLHIHTRTQACVHTHSLTHTHKHKNTHTPGRAQ